MSRGVNKVILVGNAGNDPETRYTQSGGAITQLRIATSESWNDKQSGEKQERTEWHRLKFFGKLAEIAGEYIRKGSQIYVEGSLRTDKYTDKDGIERYSTDIIVNELQLLGSKPSGEEGRDGGQRNQAQSRSGSNGHNSGRSNGGSNQSGRPQQQQSGRPQQQAPAQYAGGGFDGDGGFDPPF